ncbi:MAG: GGDEF domain-containing protein [Nitrospirota bacterium]
MPPKAPDIHLDKKELIKQSHIYQSPTFLLIIIALLIFISEASVMFIISFMRPLSTWFEAFLDAAMLVIIISPALYFLEFRPLILHITKRKQLENELRELSLRDELTGIYNRRGFFTLAESQLKLANRLKKEMLLVFADIDRMKKINDTLGHKGGDEAIIETA